MTPEAGDLVRFSRLELACAFSPFNDAHLQSLIRHIINGSTASRSCEVSWWIELQLYTWKVMQQY
jgi:hypothetical protein